MWSVPPALPPATATARGIRLQRVGKLADVLVRARRRHDDDAGFLGHAGDRDGVLQADRRLVGQRRADHHRSADHQRVGAAAALLQEARQPDHAAGAADILELEGADQAGLPRRLFNGATEPVPAAARPGRDEDEDAGEKLFGTGDARREAEAGQAGGGGEKRAALCHCWCSGRFL